MSKRTAYLILLGLCVLFWYLIYEFAFLLADLIKELAK